MSMKKTLERGLEIAEEHVASLMHRPANQLRFFGGRSFRLIDYRQAPEARAQLSKEAACCSLARCEEPGLVQAFVTPRRNCGKNQFPTLKPSHGAITQFLIWINFLTRNLVTRSHKMYPARLAPMRSGRCSLRSREK